MSSDYFESQNDRDCTIHSLNNAFGRAVVDKDEVLAHIEKVVEKQVQGLHRKGLGEDDIEKKQKIIRNKYSSGDSFFSADIVWDTAKSAGEFYETIPIPCLTKPFYRLDVLLLPEIRDKPVVLLGQANGRSNHAIAVRDGMIYDSEKRKEGPREINEKNMKKSLTQVYGGYVFVKNKSEAAQIKRLLRNITTFKRENV